MYSISVLVHHFIIHYIAEILATIKGAERRLGIVEKNQRDIIRALKIQSFEDPGTPGTPTCNTELQPSDPTPQPATSNFGVDQVQPLPIEGANASNAMSSSAIDKENLLSVHQVLAKYNQLRSELKNAGKISVILGKEAFFGLSVMEKCTPLGGNSKFKGLPLKELQQLKATMLKQYPQFWVNVKDFEPVWKKCQIALEHCCSGLRRNKKEV